MAENANNGVAPKAEKAEKKVETVKEEITDLSKLTVAELKKLASDGMGILISSHNLAELESFCNKVLIIDNGKIIETSKVNEFKSNGNKYIFKVSNTKNLEIEGIYQVKGDEFAYNGSKEEIAKIKKELNLKKDDIVVLYVGRLAQEKNVELLINAQVDLVKKNKKIKLLIVGSGPDYEKYIQMAEKLKIKNNILFTNAIPWEDMPNYYNLADVFVTASKTETQGLTVIEAMAASLPVVCVEDESFSNVVINHLNGRTFTDDKEYKMALLETIKDKKQLEKMAKQARITAEAHSLKYYAESILDVYNSAIEGSKKNKNIVTKITEIVKRGLDGKE